ncbi:MFS general substrate transporter, partial [Thelephora ganbajun]
VCLLGLVCFLCPGSFNALNGLGAAGRVDSTVNSNSNSALYATFGVAAFFAGSINNKLGPRLLLFAGSLTYSLYISSYLALTLHEKAGPFNIASGAILGIGAGLLWTAQGSLMLAYPTEDNKGKFIAIFWSIFNMGGVVGAAVSLGQNYGSNVSAAWTSLGYLGITFLVLTIVGVLIPIIMAPPNKMVRADGSRVTTPRHPSWKAEFKGLWIAFRTDPYIILLFPMFFASNYFYTWQFSDYNGVLFDIQGRALNNTVYWIAQILGSVLIGLLLDQKQYRRRVRAFLAWAILLGMVMGAHIWAWYYQKNYSRKSTPESRKLGIRDRGYIPRVLLYILFGLLDAMWQTTSYWLIGAMSNSPQRLAHFTGFYKSMQSAGAAGIWRADGARVPYLNIFYSTWGLLLGGLVFALPMMHMRIKDHTTDAFDYDEDSSSAPPRSDALED